MSTMSTMTTDARVDLGFDVMKGVKAPKVVKHFDTYAEAWAYASTKRGTYVRYWGGAKPEGK